MFRHNLNHTGQSPYDTSSNPGKLKWSFTTGDWLYSSPAVGYDSTIYVGSEDFNLYAINPDGSEKWNFTTGDLIDSSPAIGSDGTIYVGSFDNNLYAINPDSTEKWSFKTGGRVVSSPVIGSDGTIYVGSNDYKLYAINPDGTEKWNFMTGHSISYSSPAIGSDGTIYIGSNDYKLYAINLDGTEKWNFTSGGWVNTSPTISPDGTIYFGSHDNRLYAINPDGSEKWNFLTGNKVHSSPGIGYDGTIYVGSYDYNLYAINPNGTKKWSFTTGNGVRSSPAIGSDGTIYVGSYDHKLYAINPDGTEKWIYITGGLGPSSPAIDLDGTIYIGGSYEHKLYAIWEGGIPPIANAGPNQTVNEGDLVQFNGSASYDPGGYYVGEGWDRQIVDSEGDVGRWASLGVDVNGNPKISYWDYSNKDLKYARWTGTDWNNETVDSAGYVGHYNSMVLDSNGYPHMNYYDLTGHFLKYAKWTGSTWHIENVDSNGWYNSISLDSQDRPHISYCGSPSRGLKYSKWTGSEWKIEKVGNQNKTAIHTAIVLDSNDYPHISYDNNIWGNSTFEYAKWTGSTWEIEILDYSGNFGDYNSITIDENDHPHISYSDRTNGHLKYATWDGSTWNIEIVDDIGLYYSGFVHRASSIKLDINDIPHISFYDSKNGTLKYAIKNGSNWIVEIIDDEGDVGYGNSLVLQDGEIPHIAYRDNTNGDLKYATRPTGGSSELTYLWDFNNYVDSNGDGNFVNDVDAIGPNPTHIYGDDGIYIVTLRVTNNYNLSATDICNVTVQNVDPTVTFESITMDVEIGLRVAGRKYNHVSMTLSENEKIVGYVSIERMPGSPNEQMAWIPVSINFSRSYTAIVTYIPKDPPNIGGNPVWIYIKSMDGSINKIHHTFNVQQSKKRDSDHWNHVEPWEVDLKAHFIGLPFEITSHITDPGSDDETLTFTYGSQVVTITYLNNPPNPDPYPSPEVKPVDIIDTTTLVYEGPGTLSLFVEDDDGGTGSATIDLG